MNNESTALAERNHQLATVGNMGELSVQAIVDRKKKIAEVMDAVMKEGEHYGRIPGSEKPSLYKAGAEILATVFMLAPEFKITRGDLPNGHREYEIVCTLVHIATGAKLGEGVGSCSTMESKYRWRGGQRKCPKCGAAAIFNSKTPTPSEGFYCWSKKGGCGAKFGLKDESITKQETGRVENPDIADQYNTVLKMAKKRAQVDATLTATGASDVLTQDLEDLRDTSDEYRAAAAKQTEQAPPAANEQRSSAPPPPRRDADRDFDPSRHANEPAEDHDLDAIALDLIADLDKCKTPDEVRPLAKRVNALPKGTQARTSAWTHYNKRLADLAPKAAS